MCVHRNSYKPSWDALCMIILPFTGAMIFGEFRCWKMSWRRKSNVESNSAQLYGIGMLGLSHEFIKILDEEMDRLWIICYMLYVKKETLVERR